MQWPEVAPQCQAVRYNVRVLWTLNVARPMALRPNPCIAELNSILPTTVGRKEGRTCAHRAIAQEDAIRIEVDDLVSRVVGGDDCDFAAVGCKPTQDVLLGAKIIGDHLHTGSFSSCRSI